MPLQPNSQYAYSLRRVSSGWENMANVAGNPYPGGEVAMIPTGGGSMTLGASHDFDATFVAGLSLMPTNPVITQHPASQTVAIGQPASFSVSVLGAAPQYQWYTSSDTNYSNATPISGAIGSTYSIASANAGHATNYFVVVSNFASAGVTSTVARLAVRAPLNLAWLGASSFAWDLITGNWSNVVASTAGVVFQPGDNVQFTDAGRGTSPITLSGDLAPGSVAVSSSSNYTFAGSGRLVGPVQFTKAGAGTLLVQNANAFSGSVAISGGVLQLGNANALGNPTNTVTINGGSLDIRGTQSPTTLNYNIAGAGHTNGGAILNSGGNVQNANGIKGLALLGDATVGAQGRWDLNGDAGTSLRGNNFNLAKVGSGEVWFINGGLDNQLGNITILRGSLGFQGSNDLGDPAKTIAALGGTLNFYAVPEGLVMRKNIVLSNAFFGNSGGNVTLDAPITLIGTNTHGNGFQENSSMVTTFNGPISGSGGWVKNNAGQDVFNGTNTYSGVTIVNNGYLMVGPNSSLGNSSLIRLGNDLAVLDVASIGGIALGAGRTLGGIGSIYGAVTNGPGSVLSPGLTGPGSLSVSSLALNGATINVKLGSDPFQVGNGVNDYINIGGELNLGGVTTIQVSPVGPLSTDAPYTIMTCAALTGGAANLQVVSANPRYAISVVDPATTPGAIQIQVSGASTPLVWRGGKPPGPNVWNHSFTNFFNTGSGLFDRFFDGDVVTFDDTGVTNVVDVTETNSPGLLTFANNSQSYTLRNGGTLTSTLTKDGSNSVTLALSNTLALSFITNNQGTLVLSPAIDSSLPAVIVDNGSALGTIVKSGTNALTLTGDNSAYYGALAVTNGVLRYNNSAALGAPGASVYATNGGSLDINNVDTAFRPIVIAGSGFNGAGALHNSQGAWPAWPYEIVQNLTLAGHATIGSAGRWDIPGSGTLVGNGFDLTKTGGGEIWLKAAGDNGLGNIIVSAGQLGFQESATMGDPARTLTVHSNATAGLWANVNMLDKSVVLNSGTLYAGGGSNNLAGLVTLNGTNTITADNDLHLWANVSGSGGFRKLGGGALWLDAASYTGPTFIGANSTVALGASGSLASRNIQIDGGSTLNIEQAGALQLGAGQTIAGDGTVRGGTLNIGSGATLMAGTPGGVSTLTVLGSLAFQAGSTNVADIAPASDASDRIAGPATLSFGGTLVINIVGSAPSAGDSFQLFSATNYTGSFAAIVPAAPGNGLEWDASTLAVDGVLRVVGVALPQFGKVSLSGGNVILTGSGGTPGAGYGVLSHTNLAQPLINWTQVGAGTFNGSGQFSFTNAIAPGTPARFFRIRQN